MSWLDKVACNNYEVRVISSTGPLATIFMHVALFGTRLCYYQQVSITSLLFTIGEGSILVFLFFKIIFVIYLGRNLR